MPQKRIKISVSTGAFSYVTESEFENIRVRSQAFLDLCALA